MRNHTLARKASNSHSCAVLLAAAAALAPGAGAYAAGLEQKPLTEGKNHFGLSATVAFNLKANFKDIHGPSLETPYGLAPGTIEKRNYDDGYVYPDNGATTTRDFEYRAASQVTPGTLDFHSAIQTVSGGSATDRQDAAPGLELSYSRDLLNWGRTTWGLEAAFGFTTASLDGGFSDSLDLLTDSFFNGAGAALTALVPPNPDPSAIHPNGPNVPVIDNSPTRAPVVPGAGGTRSGNLSLDSKLFTLRVGPCVNIPISQRFSAQVGGGLSLVLVNSEFSFSETVARTTWAGTTSRNLSTSNTDVAVGGYLGGALTYAFTKSAAAFAGARFQAAGNVSQTLAGRQAELDLGSLLFAQAGVKLSF